VPRTLDYATINPNLR